jgi:hypothetical protein
VADWLGAPLSVMTGGLGCALAAVLVAWRSRELRSYQGE